MNYSMNLADKRVSFDYLPIFLALRALRARKSLMSPSQRGLLVVCEIVDLLTALK